MPFSDSTATSDVPPPMSSTIEPRASCTGRPAPTAAAIGSLTMSTLRARRPRRIRDRAPLDLGRAERHAHQHPREGERKRLPCTLLMKYCSIFSV
jgi:hypothetical protein